VNRNNPVSVGGSVRVSATDSVSRGKTGNGMKAALLAVVVLATAGVFFYFSTYSSAYSSNAVHASKASRPVANDRVSAESGSAERQPGQRRMLPSQAISLPLFFEPNQGQTAASVKFLAHGSGYGLFLTADEAVLQVQHSAGSSPLSAPSSRLSSRRASSSVIRMRIDGANPSAGVSGASPLRGKSNYFIGNDASKWRQNIPQFARVEYHGVYPGVDLDYYGDEGQLEYDFRVAPGADPNQIALSFQGASARIDSGGSGDLILSTGPGEVRFHAPRIYQRVDQPDAPAAGNASANAETLVRGSFRQLAANKVGFTVGEYDHSRELIIDPTLSYSTYLGGSGTEVCPSGAVAPGQGCPQVAVDTAGNIYVAGSTTSANFPVTVSGSSLTGVQNIFIAVLNPLLPPGQQLTYATYLGGTGTDTLAGLAVDALFSIYVAGTTDSTDFPTDGTVPAFQTGTIVAGNGGFPGTHGFLSKFAYPTSPASGTYALAYSTYLSGNGVDNVTGLAIDTAQNAYVTGDTTSTNPVSNGFPANANGFQTASNSPGNPQFFATMISTLSGSVSYSTFYGGGNFAGAPTANVGGGIAVDPPPNTTPNLYFTGTTNMLSVPGSNGQPALPLFAAQQTCLDQPAVTASPCPGPAPTNTNALVVKINPNQAGSNPVFATYLGGGGPDTGSGIAVDTSGDVYVTGSTASTVWVCNCTSEFQPNGYGGITTSGYGGGSSDAYVAKIGPQSGSIFPLNYFTYLGGSGQDYGSSIQVDPNQAVHVTGTTFSPNFPVTTNTLQAAPGGGGDAFVALISTTSGGTLAIPIGDYSSYLGGSGLDQGTGIALDAYYASYVAGTTQSNNFPTANAFQPTLPGPQAAFVSKIGAVSTLSVSTYTGSPSPNPVPAGTQVAFTFNITNNGPDNAFDVVFYATLNTATGLATPPTGKVTSGSGYCSAEQGTQIPCNIPSLPAGTSASVEIDVTPAISTNQPLLSVGVSGVASANNGALQVSSSQTVDVVDFTVSAQNSTPTITAGDVATIPVTFCPSIPSLGYSATITPTQTTSPAMVTATTPTFNPTTVVLSGSACGSTTLSIPTVARPVNAGSLLRRGSFYAAWMPIGGLSLMGLTIGGLSLGAGSKRRRWLAGALLGLVAGLILLQPACGSKSTTVTTNGGTSAGIYIITISGAAESQASHNTQVQLQVI